MKSQFAAAFATVEYPGVHVRPIQSPPLPRWFVFTLGIMAGVISTLAAVLLLTR